MKFSSFLEEATWRGFVYQCTDLKSLTYRMGRTKIPVYGGFDLTATSLHVGSLKMIMMMRLLQKYGHKVIVLLGGGTTKIGDPTGKDKMRSMLDQDQIRKNKDGILKIFKKYLSFEGENSAVLVDNDEWLSELKYLEFLRECGPHFTINRMLTFDSVKTRLEREVPMTFLEFNYLLLQAYDFVELFNRFDCTLQIGGSDQWGNIVNGVELGRRIVNAELYGLTTSLITTSSGKKMGKTESGAVWLNDEMLSSYDYWQFWRNVEDADVERFLKIYTDLSPSDIDEISRMKGKDINKAKILLANEATKLCHGESAAVEAESTAKKTFGEGNVGDALPTTYLSKDQLESGIKLISLLVVSGLCASNGAARRLIEGNGCRINNMVQHDGSLVIDSSLFSDGMMKLSAGKKKHAIVRLKQR